MSSVTHLTQHLQRLDTGKSVPRQTLVNYLKAFAEPDHALTGDLLNRFFGYMLNYAHWRTNAKALGESLMADLFAFQADNRMDFDLQKVHFAHFHQLVTVEHATDMNLLIQKRETFEEGGGETRRKLIPISEHQALVASLGPDGFLTIRIYGRTAVIVNGELQAIPAQTELRYTPSLELETHYWHTLEGPMMTVARFKLDEESCQGVLLRGHALQRYETLNSGGIGQHPELFYALKRIEKHFINPVTDPYHRELVTALERAAVLVKQGHPEAKRIAQGCLQKAKAALKQIFPNDKTLTVLVTNLEFSILPQQSETWTNP